MKIAVFSAKKYDRRFLEEANADGRHELHFVEAKLEAKTAPIGRDYECVCAFVNDRLDAETLEILASGRARLVALRCAGYNNVDLQSARRLGISVVRVPAYSPHAVAEHVIALLLALYRCTHRSYNRVREGNFSLEGLTGHEVNGKTVGIVGTGRIGSIAARLFRGFDCELLAHDTVENEDLKSLGLRYVSLDALLSRSDILTLHCPLLPETRHLIDEASIAKMKRGATLINTSRGGLVDTNAVYQALKTGRIGHLGIDVYEEEDKLFFEDLSSEIIQDDLFMRLTTFPNVLVTGHQAFFTNRALESIARTTLDNIAEFEDVGRCANAVV